MTGSIQFAVKSLRKTAEKAGVARPGYEVKRVEDANKKHRFVFETSVSWNDGDILLSVTTPGKTLSKRKAAFAMLQKLRADGVSVIDSTPRSPANANGGANPADAALDNDENINVYQSPLSRNSEISFHAALCSADSLDPTPTKAARENNKKHPNPFGNTNGNARSNVFTTSTATSNPFAKPTIPLNPFATQAGTEADNYTPPVAATTITTGTPTSPKKTASPFSKTTSTTKRASNPFTVKIITAPSANMRNPFEPRTPATATSNPFENPKSAQNTKSPAQETTSSGTSTTSVSKPFMNEESHKVSHVETNGPSSLTAPNDAFLAKDVREKKDTRSPSSATDASNPFTVTGSRNVNASNSCAIDSNKNRSVSSSSSPIPPNPFAKRANGINPAEGKEPSSSVPPNPFLKSNGIKCANGATVSSLRSEKPSHGATVGSSPATSHLAKNHSNGAESMHHTSAVGPNDGNGKSNNATANSSTFSAKAPKKGLNPSAAVWKPNPRTAAFVPPGMEKKIDNGNIESNINQVAHNSPIVAGYAPVLYPAPLPIVNSPRNVTVPFDPRIPNALLVSPSPSVPSAPPPTSSPLANNPNMVPHPSWNPFSGAGNAFNQSPAPRSAKPSPSPPLPTPLAVPPVFCTTNPATSNTPTDTSHPSATLHSTNAPGSTTSKALPINAPPPSVPGELDANKKSTNPFVTNYVGNSSTNINASLAAKNTSSNNNGSAPETVPFTNPFTLTHGTSESKSNTCTPTKAIAPADTFAMRSTLTSPNLKLHDTEANNARKLNNQMRDSRGTRAFDLSFGQPSPGAPRRNSPYFNRNGKANRNNNKTPIATPSSQSHYQFELQTKMKTEGSTVLDNKATMPSMVVSAPKKAKNSPSSERSPSVASSGKASNSSKKKNNPFAKPNSSNKRSAPNNANDGVAVTRNYSSQNKIDTTGTRNMNPFAGTPNNSARKKSKNANAALTRPTEGNYCKKTNRALNNVHPFEPVYENNGNGSIESTVRNDSNVSVLESSKKKKVPAAASNSPIVVSVQKKGLNGTSATNDAFATSPAAVANAKKKPYTLNPNAASFQKWTAPDENAESQDALKAADIRRVEPEVIPVVKLPVSETYVKPPSSALPIVKPPSPAAPITNIAKSAASSKAVAASASTDNVVKKSELKSELIPTFSVSSVDNNIQKEKKNSGGASSSSAAVVDTGSALINGVQKRMVVAPHIPGAAPVNGIEERKNRSLSRTPVEKSEPVKRTAKEKSKSVGTAGAASNPFPVASIAQKPKSSRPDGVPKPKATVPSATSTKPAPAAPAISATISTSIAPRCNEVEVRRPTKLWVFCNGQEANIRKMLLDLDIPENGSIETCFNLMNNTRIHRNALHCKIAAKAAVKAYALKMERFMNIELDAESETMDHKVLIVSTMNMKTHFGEEFGNVDLVEAKDLNEYVASLNK